MEGLAALLILGTIAAGMSTPSGRLVEGPLFEHDSGWLSNDKAGHFLAGVGVSMLARSTAEYLTDWDDHTIRIVGCVASTTVGIAKEFYDRDVMGSYIEEKDIVWTAAGCLLTFEWEF